MEEGEIVDNGGMVNSSIIYLMYCKNFYNATMYPTQDNNFLKWYIVTTYISVTLYPLE
jgi:hypothetical protein